MIYCPVGKELLNDDRDLDQDVHLPGM